MRHAAHRRSDELCQLRAELARQVLSSTRLPRASSV
jgi:hypothetical protein